MQTRYLARLLLIGLAILGLGTQSASAQGKKTRGRTPPALADASNRHWECDVTGEGNSPELAEKVALVRAKNKLRDHFGSQAVIVESELSDEFILGTLAKKKQAHSPEPDGDPIAHGNFTVDLHLELDAPEYRELRQRVRESAEMHRLEEVGRRIFLLGRGLIGLVAVLGGFAGYLRMEDATKGYYTTWLRVATIGLVSAVVAGLWLIP
jgi:hypothetical protein